MRIKMFLVALLLILLLSCGGSSSTSEAKKAEPAAAPVAAAPVDPNTVGTVSGKITFTGAKPKANVLSMDATPACAKMHKEPVVAEDAVIGAGGELKNAYVYVKAGLAKKEYPTPTAPVVLDQQGCVYGPHVVGVMVNQPLEIRNSDDTNHNIHPMPKVNREWNESQPPKGEVKLKTFPKEEVPPILFKCNIHPWMRAWVGVSSHPFFAVSGADGAFTIKDLPAGEYTLEAWHERFGVQEIKVKVEAKQTATADIAFKS